VFIGYSVIPTVLAPDERAEVSVLVEDPEGEELELTWDATSGDFTDDDSADTKYVCDKIGDQKLTLTARDPAGCERELELDVTCLDE